jgi:tetratricopeptide (TPR) repeat protein
VVADHGSEWEEDLEVESTPAEPAVSEAAPRVAAAAAPETPSVEPEVEIVPSRGSELEESMEEVRFYLGQGMLDQAENVLSKLEAQAPDSPELAVLRLGLDSAKQGTAQEPAPEISIEETPDTETEAPVVESAPQPQIKAAPAMSQPWPQARPAAPEPEHPKAPQTERPVLQELVSDLEASLGDNFLEEQKPAAPAEATMAHEPRVAAQEFRSGSLDDFVSDLEASLGSDLPEVQEEAPYAAPIAPAAKVAAPMAHAAAVSAGAGSLSAAVSPVRPEPQTFHTPAPTSSSPMHSAAGVDLADMFGELKQELEGETSSTDEDPETHYNLGVAFREMGLLDEAIGEFQKVTQASEHGHAFPQLMQTYTWLAQCFLDKGIPQAAIRWYETALKMPTIDQETRTALHYELASSLESAGNKTDALKNFLEVYGSNIDYRDVSERIKALRP